MTTAFTVINHCFEILFYFIYVSICMETVLPEAKRGCQTPVVGGKNGYEPPCEC